MKDESPQARRSVLKRGQKNAVAIDAPRKTWDQLDKQAQWSWEKRP